MSKVVNRFGTTNPEFARHPTMQRKNKPWDLSKKKEIHLRNFPSVLHERFKLLVDEDLVDGFWRDFVVEAVTEKLEQLEEKKSPESIAFEARYYKR